MEYIIGLTILCVIWAGFFVYRADMRKAMIWSGCTYVADLSIGFVVLKIIMPDLASERTIVPGYWDPNTLFDLGRRTGGYAIEDAIYMFLTGGIAAAIYEELFRKHIGHRRAKHKPHIAMAAGAAGGLFAASFAIWIQRKDLIKHSIFGGVSYLIVYVASFLLFLQLFPNYITLHYSIENLSGFLLLGVPLEELLFAFSFGLMWSPIYEYTKDIRSS